jgi:hypothetical protein
MDMDTREAPAVAEEEDLAAVEEAVSGDLEDSRQRNQQSENCHLKLINSSLKSSVVTCAIFIQLYVFGTDEYL